MTFDNDLDAWNKRFAAYRLREAQAMAREVLADLRGVDFSVTTLAILIGVADGRLVPGVVASRRLAAAWSRWDKAGRRRTRCAG
ncbi:MAG: hypothetical protein ACLP4V_22260 [Methylocella sp.]